MKIQELLDKHEWFKKKWLKLGEQDMYDRLQLKDIIQDKVIELKSRYLEHKLEFDKDYWLRLIQLKEIKWADWKKRYTDSIAKAICDNEFFEEELTLITEKASYEMLMSKVDTIVEYINIVKLSLRKDFSI